MVLVFHSFGRMCTTRCGYEVIGSFGVDLFFVISGFVMWASTVGRDITMMEFFTRRFFRIAPLYYIMTIIVSVAALAAPTILRSSTFDLRHIIDSLLFVPAIHPKSGQIFPVVIPGWTLNYEMFFYTIFASCLVLSAKARLPGVIGSIVVLVLLGLMFKPEEMYTSFYTREIILEFAYGVAIAALLLNHPKYSAWICAGIAAIVGVAYYVNGTIHLPLASWQMSLGILAALIVWTVCEIEMRFKVIRVGFLKWVGDASYSIYLLQMATIGACAEAWKYAGLPFKPEMAYPFAAAVIALTFICSFFTYRYLELPMQRIGSKCAKWVGAKERALNGLSESPNSTA